MRLLNSMKNTFWSLIAQVILTFVGLFVKRILLQTIGTESVGLNYLFSDVVALISIADLGITGIIIFHLYEPLSQNNRIKVNQVMNLFRKVYISIGLIVMVIGIIILPFISHLVGETTLTQSYVITIFLLFLIRSIARYFFSYKQILLYADQKGYIITIYDIITTLIYTLVSIVILLYTKNFIYVILLEIIKNIAKDFIIIKIVNKQYPYILMKNVKSLEKLEVRKIGMDVKDAFVSKLSSVLIGTTDNVVMTIFLGIGTTGLFSNYALVLKTVENVLIQLIESIQASVGNLLLEKNKQVIYSVLKKITFISFFVVSICGCCLIQLSTPFVALWFGKKYILTDVIVEIYVFNIFLYILQFGVIQYTQAAGLFKATKRVDIMGCVINIALSIIGVKVIGIAGIFLATFITRAIEFIFRIQLVFKEIIEINYFKYVKQIIGFIAIFIVEVVAMKVIVEMIYIQNVIVEFLVYGIVAVMIPSIVNIIVYHSNEDFIYMIEILKKFLKREIEYTE